ncbi:MAG: transcriptional repressor [Lachnospiraceae bacterium]
MKPLKHSRQRELIKTCLMNRYDHPTADTIYLAIREELPNISLGTVYRNLNLLVDLGEITKLTFGDGADHFDGNTIPHYHFICTDCGNVIDLPMEPLERINELAADHIHGRVDSHSIYFQGVCQDCLQKAEKSSH